MDPVSALSSTGEIKSRRAHWNTENEEPGHAAACNERGGPSVPTSKANKREPRHARLMAGEANPIRAKARSNKEKSRVERSGTSNKDSNQATPATKTAESQHVKLCIKSVDPKTAGSSADTINSIQEWLLENNNKSECKRSNTNEEKPKRLSPKAESIGPIHTKDCEDKMNPSAV